jgi:hypothetical protein
MFRGVLLSTALAFTFAAPVFAATAGSSTNSANPGVSTGQETGQGAGQTMGQGSAEQSGQMTSPKIAQRLRESLTHAGFTDVHVMPQSFLVRAKDQDGNPVMMVINPDSMTAVTAVQGSGHNGTGSQSATAGSTTQKE